MIKSYAELITIPTFEERVEYLRLYGFVGTDKFGYSRAYNQNFYTSKEWRDIKNFVIKRDGGCDLACSDHPIYADLHGKRRYRPRDIVVHHINPPTIQDYINHSSLLLDPNNLITVSDKTHRFIHYGEAHETYSTGFVERRPGDTCPWIHEHNL